MTLPSSPHSKKPWQISLLWLDVDPQWRAPFLAASLRRQPEPMCGTHEIRAAKSAAGWTAHRPSGLHQPYLPSILVGPGLSASSSVSCLVALSSALSHRPFTSVPPTGTSLVADSSGKLIQADMLAGNVSPGSRSKLWLLAWSLASQSPILDLGFLTCEVGKLH